MQVVPLPLSFDIHFAALWRCDVHFLLLPNEQTLLYLHCSRTISVFSSIKQCRRNPSHRALLVALARQNLQQRRPLREEDYLEQVRSRARAPSPPMPPPPSRLDDDDSHSGGDNESENGGDA